MIELTNPRLVKYIKDKEVLVTEGRKITRDIENIETKVKRFEDKEKLITSKVPVPKEVEERGNKLAEEINAKIKELEATAKEVTELKLSAVPADMKKDHHDLLEQKEELERERNKIALKIQKIKDKLIPLVRKEVTPLLKDEYDDIETAKLKGDKVVITTFNHVADFKSKFKKR